MSDYILGGWSQSPRNSSPATFSYVMYGMITNLSGLTAGTPAAPGWSPARSTAPAGAGKVLWTYGGGLCGPKEMPEDDGQIQAIVDATHGNGWAGVDFDDECSMNIGGVIRTMQALKPKEASYTFLAGRAYNHPETSESGRAINAAVRQIAQAGVANRHILMSYAAKMWSMSDIQANVGPAIRRTIDHGVPPKQVILALTPAGLNSENLDFFLSQVTSNQIGGLFIWNYPTLQPSDLAVIERTLGITP